MHAGGRSGRFPRPSVRPPPPDFPADPWTPASDLDPIFVDRQNLGTGCRIHRRLPQGRGGSRFLLPASWINHVFDEGRHVPMVRSCRGPGDGGRPDVDGRDGGRALAVGRAGARASRPLPAAGPAAARAVLRRLPHERRGRGGDRPGPVRRPGGGGAGRTDLAPRAGRAARPDHAAGRRGPALAGGIGPDRRMDRERLPGGPVRPARKVRRPS